MQNAFSGAAFLSGDLIPIAIAITALFAASYEIRRHLFAKTEETATAHGTSRWASRSDLRRAKLLTGPGLILGRWPGLLTAPLLRLTTEKHLLTIAPSRAGKGVSAIIPNLLTYPGSAFVIDPKGENASATARRRKEMGQRVHVLDPWHIAGYPPATFNPLDLLDPDSPDIAEDAALIADSLVMTRAVTPSDTFWEEEAKSLIAGLALYIVTSEFPEERTLSYLRRLLTLDPAELQALLDIMSESRAAGGLVARCANRLKQKPERERASVISSAQAHTHFLDSPRMAAVLSGSDFSPLDFRRQPTTVYLVLPSNRLNSYSRWLRLVLNLTLASLSERPERTKPPILFILDEFAALGRLETVETAIGLMAGYGVQLWPIVQDISQLRDLYPQRWASFIANAGMVQAFGINDPATAEMLSRMLGTRGATVRNISEGHSANGTTGGTSYNAISRPLLYPAEIRQLPPHEQLLLIDGLPPVRARKIAYYEDKSIQGLLNGRTKYERPTGGV